MKIIIIEFSILLLFYGIRSIETYFLQESQNVQKVDKTIDRMFN